MNRPWTNKKKLVTILFFPRTRKRAWYHYIRRIVYHYIQWPFWNLCRSNSSSVCRKWALIVLFTVILGQQYFGDLRCPESSIYSSVSQLFVTQGISVSKVVAARSTTLANLLVSTACCRLLEKDYFILLYSMMQVKKSLFSLLYALCGVSYCTIRK